MTYHDTMRADTAFEHFDVIYSRESTKIPAQMQIIFEFLNRFTGNSRDANLYHSGKSPKKKSDNKKLKLNSVVLI